VDSHKLISDPAATGRSPDSSHCHSKPWMGLQQCFKQDVRESTWTFLLFAYDLSVSNKSGALFDIRQVTSAQYILKLESPMCMMQCHSTISELFFYRISLRSNVFVIPSDAHSYRCLVPSTVVLLTFQHCHKFRFPSYILFITGFESKSGTKTSCDMRNAKIILGCFNRFLFC
jgi:hypothetical protein